MYLSKRHSEHHKLLVLRTENQFHFYFRKRRTYFSRTFSLSSLLMHKKKVLGSKYFRLPASNGFICFGMNGLHTIWLYFKNVCVSVCDIFFVSVLIQNLIVGISWKCLFSFILWQISVTNQKMALMLLLKKLDRQLLLHANVIFHNFWDTHILVSIR